MILIDIIEVNLDFEETSDLGDTLYGNSSSLISRQALHAYKVSFIHLLAKKELVLYAPIPKDMQIFNIKV